MRSYLTTILMGSVLNPVMYLFAIGVGIGSYVNSNTGGAGVGGVSYIVFVGPALLASAALTVAFEESAFPVMAGFKWQKVFFAMNATPVTGGQIAAGMLLAMGLRVTFTVAAFWAFLAAFGAAPAPTSFLAVPAALLGGLAFGSLVAAFASGIEDDEGWFTILQRLIIAPMFLFSGTFFPLESLPMALRWIGWISPLWHATQLGRIATYGLVEAPLVEAAHFAYLGALLALGLLVSFRNFARRLAK
jgi:lipooligosaccharide transport system permease protein